METQATVEPLAPQVSGDGLWLNAAQMENGRHEGIATVLHSGKVLDGSFRSRWKGCRGLGGLFK
jgi:hypothetical protein